MNPSYEVHAFPDALRKLADALETLAGAELAATTLNVTLHVDDSPVSDADEDTRVATVDRLAHCLGSHAETSRIQHYGTPFFFLYRGAMVTAFTALDSAGGGES